MDAHNAEPPHPVLKQQTFFCIYSTTFKRIIDGQTTHMLHSIPGREPHTYMRCSCFTQPKIKPERPQIASKTSNVRKDTFANVIPRAYRTYAHERKTRQKCKWRSHEHAAWEKTSRATLAPEAKPANTIRARYSIFMYVNVLQISPAAHDRKPNRVVVSLHELHLTLSSNL